MWDSWSRSCRQSCHSCSLSSMSERCWFTCCKTSFQRLCTESRFRRKSVVSVPTSLLLSINERPSASRPDNVCLCDGMSAWSFYDTRINITGINSKHNRDQSDLAKDGIGVTSLPSCGCTWSSGWFWLVTFRLRFNSDCGSFASNLGQAANLLCAQVNSASYSQQEGKWVVAYVLQGEDLVWLIRMVVCLLAANRGSNCSLTRAMDGRISAPGYH